jgi:hypothetical protein
MAKKFNTDLDIYGNVTISGNVDGRDISTDGSKLDGIETGADVTDSTNVISALDGASMPTATPDSSDYVLVQDQSDSYNLKRVAYSDFGGGGGGVYTFQALKSTTLALNTAYTDVTAWDSSPQITNSTYYSFNNTTGVLTLKETGEYIISAYVRCEMTTSNRIQLDVQITDTSNAQIELMHDAQYTLRNSTQRSGSAQIQNYAYDNATTNKELKLRFKRIGATGNLVAARITVFKTG